MNILITGGHSGIGLELSKLLLQEGHKLGLILRNEAKKQDAINALGTPSTIDFFYADLSNQTEVKKVAEDISTSWAQVDGWPERIMDEQALDGRLSWFAKDTGCLAELAIPHRNGGQKSDGIEASARANTPAPAMIGRLMRNTRRAAASRSKPSARLTVRVAPLRLTPG